MRIFLLIIAGLLIVLHQAAAAAPEEFVVNDVKRQAIVLHATAGSGPRPLLLVFHGHGGSARYAERRFAFHRYWPEATVVYMQGLPGVATGHDRAGMRSGWQNFPGSQGDRDLHYVDAVLSRLLATGRVDSNRVYAVGHSHGARFVNVLWKARPERFAAFCSASAQGGMLINGCPPRSIFMIMGERDRIVSYGVQKLSIPLARAALETDAGRATRSGYAVFEPGRDGCELVTYIHPGGHPWPDTATPLVVDFFKRHARPGG
jgi:polyhydroxybutyrate depolymerase